MNKDDTVEQILERCIKLINEDYKEWNPEGSDNYIANGYDMAIVLAELENLRKCFHAEAQFNKDIAEAYTDKEGRTPYKLDDEWPDFVDGDIL